MQYSMERKVLFRDCDPAGLVFYPRYFEMLNDCVEMFFAEALGWPFEVIHKSHAVPTARIAADFSAPSHHGDLLTFRLWSTHVGATSLSLSFSATCADQPRLRASSTLVLVNRDGKPVRWPEQRRMAIAPYLEAETA